MFLNWTDIQQDRSAIAESFYMPARAWNDYLRLPVWPIEPDWSNSVLENLSWLTRLHQSPTGAEQRSGLRLNPRRTLEGSMVLGHAERSFVDTALRASQTTDWLVPLWFDVTPLLADIEIGLSQLPIKVEGRSMFVNRPALIKGPGLFDYEVVQLGATQATINTLQTPTQRAWPKGTKVYPLVMARLSDDSLTLNKVTAGVATGSVRFVQQEADIHPQALIAQEYNNEPVIALEPNDREDVSQVYTFLKDTIPGSVANDFRYNTQRSGIVAQQFRYTIANSDQRYRFRMLLHALRGRLLQAYVPSFNRDLEPVGPQRRVDGGLRVKRTGYTEFGLTQATRQHVFIKPYNEPPILRKVIGSSVEFDTELLTLDNSMPRDYEDYEIHYISFMALSRLDQDTIEISHITDVDGVSEAVLTWVSIANERKDSPPNVWNFWS